MRAFATAFPRALAAWCLTFRDAERGRFVLWLPVFMGIGVLTYYNLRFEPPPWLAPAIAGPPLLAAMFTGRWPLVRAVMVVITALALGFASGLAATARMPPIETSLPSRATIITGTIRAVEALPEGRRITLEQASLDGAPTALTRNVRVRLRITDTGDVSTGDTVRVRGLIRPPPMPAYPGAWDLQRDAFYAGLGGVGYALGPVERLTQVTPTAPMRFVQWLREGIAAHVTAAIPGAAGAVSVTLLTGASMAIPEDDHAAFRDSGLAHLLAVAGLHIGIVMGFALTLARLGLALSEHASLHWPAKPLAALTALIAGGLYMVLTGMHVPIVRSFAMACLVTVAVMAGRQPVSVRGLGLAGAAIMLIEPWEVPGVSFQMSFSAVLALIAGYEALRPWLRRLHGKSWRHHVGSHIAALALTSALAGTASMPFGAYHFGRIQVYYVIANMIAVPLTAFWVMPLGLLALPLMPLGLDWIMLVPMGWGAALVVWVARVTASWPAATFEVPHIPSWGLAVLSMGLAWLGIWRTRIRLLGVLAIVTGLISPVMDHPPDILVSADARLIGVRTGAGPLFHRSQGGSQFTRDAWIQYWGSGQPQIMPVAGQAAGGAVVCVKDECLLRPRAGGAAALLIRGTGKLGFCRDAQVVVSSEPARGICARPWPTVVDRFTVWRDGSAGIWLGPGGIKVVTDRATRGDRPWVPPPPKPRPRPEPLLPPAQTDRDERAEIEPW